MAMPKRSPVEKLLTPTQAVQFAQTAAQDFTESRLKVSLHLATANAPTLVQRIDRTDSYYFIVPFNIASRETARFIVDGFAGKLKQASGVYKEGLSFEPYVSQPEALDRLIAAQSASKLKWEFVFRRELIGQHPVLVWRPCRQSPSPFLPFYQFSAGSSLVYLRIDGQLFGRLTTGPV